ncbi:Crp/Fnr family transcriptional regulator [Kibdelosporangium persicum]|uniref:Crp/Fnr family transcriptional regulator n=1 Tax=Kibdelosporangium persicum TaxID=2698649 RepID=UPI0028A7D8B6|nr:Crp/Fnr family transcriptional regulator [Kibdelosporangium persicum]
MQAGISHDTVHRVLREPVGATWSSLKGVVEALGGNVSDFFAEWSAHHSVDEVRDASTVGPSVQTAPPASPGALALDSNRAKRRRTAGASLAYPQSSLLGRLSDRTLEDFLAAGVSESRPAGLTLYSQGDNDSSALLLLHGSVKLTGRDPTGERTLLAIRVGGDLIGEMSALDIGPREATAVAATDIFFKRMTKAEFRNFLARHPDAAIEVAAMLSERLRYADRRRMEHGRPASVRVARVLVDLYESYGVRTGVRWDLTVPLTREELASIVGIKLTTAEKIIRTFQQEGLVSGRYRQIAIIDMAGLRRRAEIA